MCNILVLSVRVGFKVLDRRNGVFKVTCASTGGRVLSMFISGPSFAVTEKEVDITGVGSTQRTGNDSYSAEILVHGGNNSDVYSCFFSNVVSNSTSRSHLKGIDVYKFVMYLW